MFTAQTYDKNAGDLTARKAKGGPKKLKNQEFYFGINDTVARDYQTHENFNPVVMPLYDAWNRYNKHADRATIRDSSSVVVQLLHGVRHCLIPYLFTLVALKV